MRQLSELEKQKFLIFLKKKKIYYFSKKKKKKKKKKIFPHFWMTAHQAVK